MQESLPSFTVSAGYICVPSSPSLLRGVAGSGIIVTAFDRLLKIGGMSSFTHPRRKNEESTPHFAAPAIQGLVDLLLAEGALLRRLEFSLYGGAENPRSPRHSSTLPIENAQVAISVLEQIGGTIIHDDTGGRFGRKVIFNTATGESVIARVAKIRNEDWYPPLNSGRERARKSP